MDNYKVTQPPNINGAINELYAFVSLDNEGEGIIAATCEIDGQTVMMPLITSMISKIDDMRTVAKKIQKCASNPIKIRLLKFTDKEILEEF